jgi:hypothetical protein
VTEQLTPCERGLKGAAVFGRELLIMADTVSVDSPSNQLFASAGFANQQNVHSHGGGSSDLFEQLPHYLAPTHDLAKTGAMLAHFQTSLSAAIRHLLMVIRVRSQTIADHQKWRNRLQCGLASTSAGLLPAQSKRTFWQFFTTLASLYLPNPHPVLSILEVPLAACDGRAAHLSRL